MKVGRNDPCPCGSGKKFKKCCGFNSVPSAEPEVAVDAESDNRKNLDTQLAKYAPNVTLDQIEKKISDALKAEVKVNPVKVIEEVFNDDNLNLKNKKQADRLFKAFMAVWNDIYAKEKNQ